MLKISEKTNIGLLFMLTVAQAREEGASASIADVVRHWKFLSSGYVEEIVGALRRAELVRGKKGKGGGYTLARPAETITMFDIVTALEGPIALVETLVHKKMRDMTTKMRNTTEGPSVSLDRRSFCTPFEGWCVSRRLWGRLQQGVEETLKGMTLQDLVREGEQFQPTTSEIRNPKHEILNKSK